MPKKVYYEDSHNTPNTMIQNTTYNSLNSAGIKSAVSFGIKDTGLAHIFNVLRNQLYTDKIGAVVREYAANAYDANVEAGKPNTGIVITMPSRLTKVFKIRDFGRGLSEQDIQDIYCFYGESTKRQSNAFIGQLGLGSKSAFAYGDNFVINSFTDGKVRSYNAFIDPSGIGQIALLSSQDTTEENGVEIVIPVKGEDANYFTDAVKRYLRFFKVRPTIIGMEQAQQDAIFAEPITKGNGWAFYDNNQQNSPMAVMGNIAYPIDRHSIKLVSASDTDSQINYLLHSSIVIDFGIGDLDVAASREGLQYTDRTIEAIKAKAQDIIKTLVSDIQKQVTQNANSEFAAKKLLSSMDDLVGGFHYVRQIVKNITFKGKVISNDYVSVNGSSKDNLLCFRVMRYRRNWNGNVQTTQLDEIQARHDSKLVFNDLGHYNAGARYARYLAGQNTNNSNRESIFLLTIQKREKVGGSDSFKALKAAEFVTYAKQIAELKEANGFCDDDFINASSITLPANLPSESSKSKRTGALMFDPANANSWRSRNAWNTCNVDMKNSSGVYARVNNFSVIYGDNEQSMSPSSLVEMLKPFKSVNAASIVGFTKTQLKSKMGAGWVRLEDKLTEEFDSFVEKNQIDIAKILAYKSGYAKISGCSLAMINSAIDQNMILSLIKDDSTRNTIADLFKCVNSRNHSADSKSASNEDIALMMLSKIEQLGLASVCRNSKNAGSEKIAQDIADRVKALEAKLPMLAYIEDKNMRWAFSAKFVKVLTDYING